MVLPYSWWDLEAVAAMEWIQAEVVASMAMAEAARAQAAVELAAIWAEPGALNFLKDLAQGFVAGLEDLLKTAEMGIMLSPQRAMVDPMGWFHDTESFAKGMWKAVQHPGVIMKKLVDWEDWTNGYPGRAIGKLAPMAIIAVATAGSGAAADAGVAGGEVAGEVGTEAVGTTVTEEVVGASTVQAGEATGETVTNEVASQAARPSWWAPGWESGPPPNIELGEIKPIASWEKGFAQINERGAAGNDALVTFDNSGTVHMQVYGDPAGTGTKSIVWEDDIGQVSRLPSAPPGTTQFGNEMEPMVRDLVSNATGQNFGAKASNAGGPDLVPFP
jgi:hypothetical protein